MHLPLILTLFCTTVCAGASTQKCLNNSILCYYQNDINGLFIYEKFSTRTRGYFPTGQTFIETTIKGVFRKQYPLYSMMGMGFERAHFPKGENSFRIAFTYMPKRIVTFDEFRLREFNNEKIADTYWKDSALSAIPMEMFFLQIAQIFRAKLLSQHERLRLRALFGLGICPGFLILHDSLGRKPIPSIYGFPLLGIQLFPVNRFSVSLETTYSFGLSQEQTWGSRVEAMPIISVSELRYRYVMNGVRISTYIHYYFRCF